MPEPGTARLHATCVAVGADGVLLLGAPGAGKSDLALRLIDQAGAGFSGRLRAAQLVADDQVLLRRDADGVVATAPAAIKGRLEIRGLGIVSLPVRDGVTLTLAVRLVPAAAIARLPEPADSRFDLLGVSLPLLLVDPLAASAPARIRAALDHFGASE